MIDQRLDIALLERWQKISSALGREEEGHALALQIAIARGWADGDAVLAAVAGVPERFAALGKRLFEQWRDMVVCQTLGPPRRDGDPPGTAWVGALVDGAAGRVAPVFGAAVSAWLDDLARNRNAVIESVTALATLTRDLSGGRVARSSPALARALGHVAEQGGALQPWRRRAARRLGGTDVLALVMDFWKHHVAEVVPDPGSNVGSDYARCADWLAAVHELNMTAYKRLLADWTVRHRLRRNLWREIDARKLARDTR